MSVSTPVKTPKLNTPETGSILYDDDMLPGHERLFLIVSIVHDEVAIVRLFRQGELTQELEKRCLPVPGIVTIRINETKQEEQLYADVSKIIPREHAILDKYHSRVAGRLIRRDVRQLIKAMMGVNTISQAIKNKFFTGAHT